MTSIHGVAASRRAKGAQSLLILIIVVGAAACIGIVMWQLLVNGQFTWHVQRPRFWQGGIEALALLALLSAAQLLKERKWRLIASAVVAEIYLRRHAVDLSVLIDVLYLELVIALGGGVAQLGGVPRANDVAAYLRCFVLGFSIWSVCAWTISAFGFGSVIDLRWLTLLLVLPALAVRAQPWTLFVERRVHTMPFAIRVCIALLLGWFLVLFAHSATAIGYDDQWYAIRSDRVLVAAGSIFKSEGLVSPVYYFPKVYELFLTPLSGFGSSTMIVGMSILMLGLLAASVDTVLRQLGIKTVAPRLLGIALVVSLPAVANSALTAKPDVLVALLVCMSWAHASAFITTRDRGALGWMLGLLLLATQAKLTAIPFAAALFLVTLAAARWIPRTLPDSTNADARLGFVALALIIVVCGYASARTWLLAGMPTVGPDPLVKLWHLFGLSLTYPVGTLQWNVAKDWSETPELILDWLFRPQNMSMMQITWIGNVWAWLAVIALCAKRLLVQPIRPATAPETKFAAEVSAARWPGFGLLLTAFALMLCWGFSNRGGDGNYFIAGLIPAILLGLAAAWTRLPQRPRQVLAGTACAFVLFQASYSFVSASWTGGTRPFDLDFQRSVRNIRHESIRTYHELGIFQIAERLRALDPATRVVGCTESGDTLGFRLPVRYEDAAQIAFSRREFPSSEDKFIEFLKADRIDYLLVPRADTNPEKCPTGHVIVNLANHLSSDPSIPSLQDERYVLYDIRSWQQK